MSLCLVVNRRVQVLGACSQVWEVIWGQFYALLRAVLVNRGEKAEIRNKELHPCSLVGTVRPLSGHLKMVD